jgi:hypothetical protein
MDATGRDCHESAGLLGGESPEFICRHEMMAKGKRGRRTHAEACRWPKVAGVEERNKRDSKEVKAGQKRTRLYWTS